MVLSDDQAVSGPVIWGIILAVATDPFIEWFAGILGGRKSLATVIFVVLVIALIIIPTVFIVAYSIVIRFKPSPNSSVTIRRLFPLPRITSGTGRLSANRPTGHGIWPQQTSAQP